MRKVSPTPVNREKPAKLESSLQAEMMQAKLTYERHLVDNFAFDRDYKIFKYIHSATSHDAIPSVMYFSTTSACSNADIATLFNAYFNTTFTKVRITSAPRSNVPYLSE